MAISQRIANIGRVGAPRAVFDQKYHALYFSKEVVPFMDIQMAC